MGLGIPPLQIKIMLESNPLKSTMLVGRLGVPSPPRLDLLGRVVEADAHAAVRVGARLHLGSE